MPKKICFIGTQFIGVPANKGGAIEYLSFKIAKGLSGKGFEITYFSVNPLVKSRQDFAVNRFPAKKTNGFFFSLFVLVKSLFKKFDLIYVSGCSMIFAGLILSKFKGIPLVYHEFNHNPWIKPKNKLYDFLARFSVKVSDFIIVPNKFIKQAILNQTKINSEKLFLISNFTDLTEFPLKPKKKEKKLLFVGRLVKHKGIDFLIELIKKDDLHNWVFEFVAPKGFSVEEKKYSNKIKSLSNSNKGKIIFKSNISRNALIKEFSSSSILLLPSSQESFGLVLIEAMACFTPCIAFSVGGTTEIIDNRLNGFLVELNNKTLFKERLRELMNNEKKRIAFGLNARNKVEQKFSFVNSIKEFELFFNNILVNKK